MVGIWSVIDRCVPTPSMSVPNRSAGISMGMLAPLSAGSISRAHLGGWCRGRLARRHPRCGRGGAGGFVPATPRTGAACGRTRQGRTMRRRTAPIGSSSTASIDTQGGRIRPGSASVSAGGHAGRGAPSWTAPDQRRAGISSSVWPSGGAPPGTAHLVQNFFGPVTD